MDNGFKDMNKPTLAEQIKKEEDALRKTQNRISALKEKEAKRLLKIAEKSGYFTVSVSDADIESAFTNMVSKATNSS